MNDAVALRNVAPDGTPADDAELRPERRSAIFYVVSGPGGTGKTTLVRRWLQDDPTLGYVRNYTTRAPRAVDEQSGVDDSDWFEFVSPAEFQRLVREDFFVQWANAAQGYASGTPVGPLHEAAEEGRDLVFDYTPQLFVNLRRLFRRHTVGIFVVPPSFGELERRLRARGADDAQIELKRQMGAQDLAFMDEHDYALVNDDADDALAALKAIRRAEAARIDRMDGLAERYRRLSPRAMLFYYDPWGRRIDQIDPE